VFFITWLFIFVVLFLFYLLVNVSLELASPEVGVGDLSTTILALLMQPELEVTVISRLPWVVPVQSTTTDESVSLPIMLPLVAVQRKV
jgi:hypothetical protein